MGSPDTLIYYDANTLMEDDSLDLEWFLQLLVARFDERYKPITAFQPRLLQHPGGLRERGPKQPLANMFTGFDLSPAVVFQERHEVSMCNEGAIYPPHLSHSSIGTLHTLIEYEQPFIAWPPTDKNLEVMQGWTLQTLGSWEDALKVMRKLEGTLFTYANFGSTVYVPAGHTCTTLSRYNAADYRIKLANPAIAEWDDINRAYDSFVEGIYKNAVGDCLRLLAAALERLQTEHDLCKRVVAGLPQHRTADTVSKGEVKKKGLCNDRARIWTG